MIRQLPTEIRSYLRSGVAITSVTQCVEELFLNAVDAGATCVAVRLDLDAFKVQVVDNGCGVDENQLAMLGERYSTSKCHLLTDLDNLCYYGYRGEALASIRDSCGILEVTTRTDKSAKTFCKMFQKGKALKVTESAIPRPSVGTTVTVHDLFQNFPVRRKHTNPGLELERVRQRLEGLALLKPAVSVSLRNDLTGNVILQTHKCSDTVKTFAYLFGMERAKTLVEVSGCEMQYSVTGYIGKTAYSKKDLQFVFINGRLVLKTKVHKYVNQAMAKCVIFKRSYGQNGNTPEITQRQSLSTSPTKFMDKHPFYVLNIKCPLTEYDVTFDPSKTLVEFKDWEPLLQCITDMVNCFLKKEKLFGSPDTQVATDENDNSNSNQTDFDVVIKAACEISPSDMKDVLASKRVKRKIVEKLEENVYKTPKTMSVEEWKAKNEVKAPKVKQSNDTSTSEASIETTSSDVSTCIDTSYATGTANDGAISLNDATQSPVSYSSHRTCNRVCESKEEVKPRSLGNRIEQKIHSVSAVEEYDNIPVKNTSVSEQSKVMQSERHLPISRLNKENPQEQITDKGSDDILVPNSSLSMYRKSLGKPVTHLSSDVTVESSLKKISSLFPEKKSDSLSSLQRFRQQFKKTSNDLSFKPVELTCSGARDLGLGSSRYSNPFAGIHPRPQPAREQVPQKSSTNTAENQRSTLPDNSINSRQLTSCDGANNNAENEQSSSKDIQHGKGKLMAVSRKRVNETKYSGSTSAAKLSRLVLEHTSSITIDPDDRHSGNKNFELWPCVDLDMVKIQTISKTPHRSNISKQIDMLDRDITALSEDILGKSKGSSLGQKNLCKAYFPAQDMFHPAIHHYESTQSTSCVAGVGAEDTSCATGVGAEDTSCAAGVGAEDTSCSAGVGAEDTSCAAGVGADETLSCISCVPCTSAADRGHAAGEISGNRYCVTDNNRTEQNSSKQTHTDNNNEYSTVKRNYDNFDHDVSLEPMDTEGVEQLDLNTGGQYLYRAVPLNINAAGNAMSYPDKHDNILENSGIEGTGPFSVGTQSFSPQLSQSSLNNRMTEINLSQGFTPAETDIDLAENLTDTCKTPQSGGFSPQLDSPCYGSAHALNDLVDTDSSMTVDLRDNCDQDTHIKQDDCSSDLYPSRKHGMPDSSQNSPDTLDIVTHATHSTAETDVYKQKRETAGNCGNSSSCLSEDVTVTQLLNKDSGAGKSVLSSLSVPSVRTQVKFSDIFSPSQSDDIKSNLCGQCHSVNRSEDCDSTRAVNNEMENKATDLDVSNCSWNSTWSSVHHIAQRDEYSQDMSVINNTCDTYDTTLEPRENDMNCSQVEDHTCKSNKNDEYATRVDIDETGDNSCGMQNSGRYVQGCVTTEKLSVGKSESFQTTGTLEPGTGPWVEMTDPVTGKQLFVHSMSGATVYGASFKGKIVPDKSPVKLERLFHKPGSVRIKPGTGSNTGPDNGSSSSVTDMLEEYMEQEEGEDIKVKWRSPGDRDKDTGQKEPTLDAMFEEWSNPLLQCSSKEVLSGEMSGLPSRAVLNAYRSMHTCTFTKDMLKTIEVIGQLDKKFIACLINTGQQTAVRDPDETAPAGAVSSGFSPFTDGPDMLAVIDQHAAHERIRLEMLTEESYIDGDKDCGQLCLYRVTPPRSMTLTENEVRVMVAYREELKRIGIMFETDLESRVRVHVKSVPECLVVKGETGGKRKEGYIYWDTIEALIKEHVELLCLTHGSKGRLPKVIHKILCSLACHGAIKFGDPLTLVESKALIHDLTMCDLPFQCAHGRPSVMPVLQLEQLQTKLPQTKPKKPQLYKLTQALAEKTGNI